MFKTILPTNQITNRSHTYTKLLGILCQPLFICFRFRKKTNKAKKENKQIHNETHTHSHKHTHTFYSFVKHHFHYYILSLCLFYSFRMSIRHSHLVYNLGGNALITHIHKYTTNLILLYIT